MKKNFYLLIVFFFFSQCSSPGVSLLGPIFTGAKTGSAMQASLSYGTNHILKKIHEDSENKNRSTNIHRWFNFQLKRVFYYYKNHLLLM